MRSTKKEKNISFIGVLCNDDGMREKKTAFVILYISH